MPDHTERPPTPESATPTRRGQSLVEFALVLPMLLVLLLGVADFGRVFAAGITVEAMSRNAAEAAAQEYLQLRRAAAPAQPDSIAYEAVRARAAEVACEEAEALPNRVVSGTDCAMPVIGTCVHDEWGDHCGSTTATPPAGCTEMASWPPPLASQSGGLPYIQVTACYRFTTLIDLSSVNLPLGWSISIGEIWLQRERVFTVADY